MSEIGQLGQVVTKYLAKREMRHEGTLIRFKFDAAITLDYDVSCMIGRHVLHLNPFRCYELGTWKVMVDAASEMVQQAHGPSHIQSIS